MSDRKELRDEIQGVVQASRSTLSDWSSEMVGLRISESGRISLAREFSRAALDSYEKLGEAVDAECDELKLWASVFPPLEDV